MLTPEIEHHCHQHGIQIIRLSNGAYRFLGAAIDLTIEPGQSVKLTDLKPRKKGKE